MTKSEVLNEMKVRLADWYNNKSNELDVDVRNDYQYNIDDMLYWIKKVESIDNLD